MRKFLGMAVATLMLVACAATSTVAQTEDIVITGKRGKQEAFQVEVVSKDEDRARGLMGRTSLPERGGMLFVFQTVQSSAFWMKNTLIPLDMIFIDESGKIVKIHSMAVPHSREVIKSGVPVKAGLEINGGMARKLGLKAGDIVHHRVFGNQLAAP